MNSDERDDSIEERNHITLLAVRREMLARVACLTSQDLPLRVGLTELRKTDMVLGVFDHAWRYPAFQFDCDGRPQPEMSEILKHLNPDKCGWDRLQWFLDSNPTLSGRSPLEVWLNGDRTAVLEASRREVWQGRD